MERGKELYREIDKQSDEQDFKRVTYTWREEKRKTLRFLYKIHKKNRSIFYYMIYRGSYKRDGMVLEYEHLHIIQRKRDLQRDGILQRESDLY